MQRFMLALVTIVAAPTISGEAIAQSGQSHIIMNEGARPADVTRTFSGRCGDDRYSARIVPGPLTAKTIEELVVNGRPVAPFPESILSGAKSGVRAIDLVIHECENERALMNLIVADPANSYRLDSYYFWLSDSGIPSALFQR